MTFIVAWATPHLGLIAADTRAWRVPVAGGPVVPAGDDVEKLRPMVNGWLATGGYTDLADVVASACADVALDLHTLRATVARVRTAHPGLLGPAGVTKSWLIGATPQGARCMAVDWWTAATEDVPPDHIGLGAPYPLTVDDLGDLVCAYGAQLAPHLNRGADRTAAGLQGAVAATRRFFHAVRARLGPDGSVGPRLDVRVVAEPALLREVVA